jgi:hypothetical protein
MAEQPPPTQPSPTEAREWVGHRIDEIGGSTLGRAQGLFVDCESGEAAWLTARLGRFGRLIAIPAADCAGGAGHVWVPYTREVLREAPVVDPAKSLTREQELAICAHFGIPPELGRASQVSPRPVGAVTARPDPA